MIRSTLRVLVVKAFSSSDIESAQDDNSDYTQRDRQQTSRHPYDDVSDHVHHAAIFIV